MLSAHSLISGYILWLNLSDFTSVKAVALSKIYSSNQMRFVYFYLCCFLLLSTPSFAQFSRSIAEMKRDRAQEAQLLRTQPLLVVLKQEDEKQLKKLARKPDELRAYQQFIALGNALLQQVAGPAWTFSPKVEYKSEAELAALVAANPGQLNVLDLEPVDYLDAPPPMRRYGDPGPIMSGHRDELLTFRLRIFIKQVDFTIHNEPLLGPTPSQSDALYCVKMLEQYAAGAGPQRIKSGSTPPMLLLCQDDRAPGLTDAQIKQVYPYSYQFVARPEYEKAVHEAAPGVAFVRMAWQAYGTISPMAYALPGFGIVSGGDLHRLKAPLITLQDFKSFKKTLLR